MVRFVSLGLWTLVFMLAGSYGETGYRRAHADSVFRVPSTPSASVTVAATLPVARIGGPGRAIEGQPIATSPAAARLASLQDAGPEGASPARIALLTGASDRVIDAVALPSFTAPEVGPEVGPEVSYGATWSDLEVQIRCLALNIYWEARSEPLLGKIAVAKVTLNRVKDAGFPDSICGVVRQGEERVLHQCQFSWFCDGRKDVPLNQAAWRLAEEVAHLVVLYDAPDPTQGALWYHADYADPPWTRSMTRTTQIGRHIYYVQG